MQIVDSYQRLGEENAFTVLARANQLAAQGRDIINLGIGQPNFPTPDHIVAAAIKALRDGQHGYTDAAGIKPLREAVSADLRRRLDVEISPQRVMIMPGGKPTMFAAITLFGQPGVEILYPDPGFPIYRSLIDFTGADAVAVPVREETQFAFSAEETLSLINERSRLLIVNSPGNPCGGVTPKSELDKLVAGLLDYPDVAILSDEIYDQLLYDGRQHHSLLNYPKIADRVILLNGWSKTYAMTGWRLGYSVWPQAWFEYVRKLAVNHWSCVNTAAQYAALEALQGPQDFVATMRSAFDERRVQLAAALNAIDNVSCISPAGAFYVFANIKKTGISSSLLATNLLEDAGVATISGADFGALGEGYIRLSCANSLENLLAAAERIKHYLC